MGRYAEGTDVSVESSRQEIEKILRRYGADGFISGFGGGRSLVAFTIHARQVRFDVPMPDPSEFRKTAGGVTRNDAAMLKAAEQEERRRWRALTLAIKAKLEVVETGIATFEEEFLAHIVLPNGEQVGRWMAPQIADAYETAKMPELLPALGPGKKK